MTQAESDALGENAIRRHGVRAYARLQLKFR